MTGRFWVYLNTPNNRATVHAAACAHCNDGQGRTADKLRWNGEWHGPYADQDQAMGFARASGKKTVRTCGHCARTR